DLLVLFVFPVGWVPLVLGNLGFLFFVYQFAVLRLLWIVPLVVYISFLFPSVREWIGRRRARTGAEKG
ncbi:MAG: hypothetical protein AB1531_07195, partial [Chloroflexota bacterium]